MGDGVNEYKKKNSLFVSYTGIKVIIELSQSEPTLLSLLTTSLSFSFSPCPLFPFSLPAPSLPSPSLPLFSSCHPPPKNRTKDDQVWVRFKGLGYKTLQTATVFYSSSGSVSALLYPRRRSTGWAQGWSVS